MWEQGYGVEVTTVTGEVRGGNPVIEKKRDDVKSRIGNTEVIPKASLTYLRVTFGANGTFVRHVKEASSRTE